MKRAFLLFITAVLLMMTGCVSSETRDEIIECLKDDGYIGESDSFEYSFTESLGLLPTYESYNYIYSNGSEELYDVRIDADSDDGVYTVDILYGVEISETSYFTDGEEVTERSVEAYDSKVTLTVTEKSFLFFEWLEVEENDV
jgi:ribosomal protein S8